MRPFFRFPTTIYAQNENPAHTKEALTSHTHTQHTQRHIRKMPQEQCEFRVAHIHIMANYFIATNAAAAAIDITFTFSRSFFSPSSFHSLYPLDYCFVITTEMMAIFIVYERKLKNPRNSYGPMLCSHYIIKYYSKPY